MTITALNDLPPELLLHITDYLSQASSIARLERTSKKLRAFVEDEAWRSFARTRFPTICPTESPSYKDTTRTLTSLSRAFDRRAFVARSIEPTRDITAYPSKRRIERWKRPHGQTIGFTPHIDVYENIGPTWHDREETLAFSAGAEVCLRQTTRRRKEEASSRWTTYRPLSAYEGRDDVTCLHLVRPRGSTSTTHDIITGTANGDLQMTCLPRSGSSAEDVRITYFTTQGMPVRSSSLLQGEGHLPLLAASLGESSLALYQVDGQRTKISPSSQVDLKPVLRADGHPVSQRIWSTKFLSPSTLAIGVGPSAQPIQIFSITQTGITSEPLRKFALEEEVSKLENGVTSKPPTSSVYTTEPLPSSSASGSVFLSGAYDGIVRLHDMRSNSEHEKRFIDPSDDSPIYSILPRGEEKILVGTGRHNLLKTFDLRMGAKCYDSSPVHGDVPKARPSDDYNVYLRTKTGNTGANWSRGRSRPVESSVYSLASSSPASPYIYAGLESVIMSLALTETLNRKPDPAHFTPRLESSGQPGLSCVFQQNGILDLAMHDQGSMVLYQQRSPWKTVRAQKAGRIGLEGLDARWKNAAEVDLE